MGSNYLIGYDYETLEKWISQCYCWIFPNLGIYFSFLVYKADQSVNRFVEVFKAVLNQRPCWAIIWSQWSLQIWREGHPGWGPSVTGLPFKIQSHPQDETLEYLIMPPVRFSIKYVHTYLHLVWILSFIPRNSKPRS